MFRSKLRGRALIRWPSPQAIKSSGRPQGLITEAGPAEGEERERKREQMKRWRERRKRYRNLLPPHAQPAPGGGRRRRGRSRREHPGGEKQLKAAAPLETTALHGPAMGRVHGLAALGRREAEINPAGERERPP